MRGNVTDRAIISARKLTYRYRQEDPRPVLDGIDLDIAPDDYLLVTGRSGSGKSTLCRTFNGLIPHFYGGVLEGDLFVDGRPIRRTTVAALFDRVAMAFQNPDAQLFCRSVEQEIVFGLESLGVSRRAIEERLAAALEAVGIGALRYLAPQNLSGGEKHLVLIAALLALRPRVLVLDEPFANLDPHNVLRIRGLLRNLHAGGCGIVVCEHRLSRVVPDATRMVVIHGGRIAADGDPHHLLAHADETWGLEPPLATRLATALGWAPSPRTIDDLRGTPPRNDLIEALEPSLPQNVIKPDRQPVLEVDHLSDHAAGRPLLKNIDFTLHPGECLAIVGANGAGKTTLLRHLMGRQRPSRGAIRIDGHDIGKTPVSEVAQTVGMAFQNPDNQFFRFTVEQEIRVGPEALHCLDTDWIAELMTLFQLTPYRSKAPYRLSGGEKKRVAFASALAARPKVLALDEPTAGQDFDFRRNLRTFLHRMQARGQAIIIVTHDLTFAERTAGRWLLMAEGRLLADGRPGDIMADTARMSRAGLEATDRFLIQQLWQTGGSHA
jgi:energy-coupling factor transporter ATP-binding protein EcfA2